MKPRKRAVAAPARVLTKIAAASTAAMNASDTAQGHLRRMPNRPAGTSADAHVSATDTGRCHVPRMPPSTSTAEASMNRFSIAIGPASVQAASASARLNTHAAAERSLPVALLATCFPRLPRCSSS